LTRPAKEKALAPDLLYWVGERVGGREAREFLPMEDQVAPAEEYQPEFYCLRCQLMEWDPERRQCTNFGQATCPLSIRQLLAGIHLNCMVV
jgi:hypothetical protein